MIGREHELARAEALLASARLLTLTGPPGVGKTRLALELAQRRAAAWPARVWLVALEGADDRHLLLAAVGRALGLREAAGAPLLPRVRAVLAAGPALVVLDGAEHLVAALGALAADLLAVCPDLQVLVTSRAPLRISGEQELPVPPLALPRPAEPTDPGALERSAAVELFVHRAAAVWPDFELTADNGSAVAEICRRLDGLPLAIELAAGWARLLSPAALLARLHDRLGILTQGPRDLPARHRSLRAALDSSYDLLTPAHQRLFARLAVFVGAFPVEAAEAVCGDDRSGGVLDGLAVLVAHSLLQQTRADGRVRFHMLGTVREYALERLQDSGGAETARRAHAAYVLAVAQEAAAGLIGPVQAAALDRLARVHDDAVAALRWAVEANEADVALPLVAALWRFWSVRGPLDAADGWLAAALALGGGPAAARAEALRGAGFLAADAGDHVRAARSHVRRLALLRDLGDRRGAAEALTDLGIVLCDQGHTIAARHCLAQGLAVLRELDDRRGVAGALHHLGRVAREEGDPDRAAALLGESLAIRQELGDARGVALSLAGLGLVARLRNDPGGAAARFAESLALFRELGDAPGTAVALEQLAGAAVVLGDAARAGRLFGAAEALRERLEVPAAPARRRDRDRDVGAARAALGSDAFAAAWAAGRALPPDAAVAEALAVAQAPGTRGARPRSAWADGAPGLTPREREVAALVAAGFSNRRIAEALVVSERTAEGHVERIRRKLGMHSRAQIAAWVARQALPDPAPRTE